MPAKIVIIGLLSATTLIANGGSITNRRPLPLRKKMAEVVLPNEAKHVEARKGPILQATDVPPVRTLGTYTGLTGFFDFQCNVGACQYIRVDPSDASGNHIHVIYMSGPDSTTDPNHPNRRTYYRYSTDAGATWDVFTPPLVVPERRSGYPSIDMLQGTIQATIVANHNDAGSGNASFMYIDSPPGSGAFSEIGTPPPLGGGDEPIWPDIAGASDGSIVVNASRSTANTDWRSRTSDYISWDPWTEITPSGSAGIPTKSNAAGRVGCLVNGFFAGNTGIHFIESTNNGATWPATASLLVPPTRIAGPDSFSYTLGCDFVYNGNDANVAFGEENADPLAPTDSAQITFWSPSTQFVVVASKRNTPGVAPVENRQTFNTTTMDMPSIGLSGSVIVIAYHAMMNNDTSANGYNCCDIFMVASSDGGQTWSTPRNLSNSRGLDDRFVSVAPWNPPGVVNLVWQEDTEAGGNIIGDPGATVQRARQVFLRTTPLAGVEQGALLPSAFALEQNYPNPFNPSTTIGYTVAKAGRVTIKVYDALGREVAVLLNDDRAPGTYQAPFNTTRLASGVYFYRMIASGFTQTKEMLLLK